MRSIDNFICTPKGGTRYSNTKDFDGVSLIVNSSEEDHKFSNREATVIECPVRYKGPVRKGDTIFVHHNVFKFYNDTKGRRTNSMSFYKDDQFLVNTEQFFMYKRDKDWVAHDRFCFVKPVAAEGDFNAMKYEPLIGVMMYPSEYLISKGVKRGDKVSYTPESEYEFSVDGELMYRVFESQITSCL